jgi:uncharacterized membrane protein YGL010W
MHAAAETSPHADVRRLHRLLGQYAQSHRHPTNVLIHWLCVPVIVWCVLAFAHALHPALAWAGSVAALVWYLRLSPPLALAMALFAVLVLTTLPFVPSPVTIAAVAFVVTWVLQFYGHHVEGRRPSFLEDLRFLLVGPLFLLAKLYRRLGWRI